MPASDKNWYSLKKLHLVFAVSAAALFIATLWMIKKDHKDDPYEWPAYQTTFDEIQIERNKRTLQSMTTDEFKKQKKALEEARDLAQKKIDKNADQVNSLKKQIKDFAHQFDLAKRADKNRKAFWTKAKADRDLAIRDGKTGDELKSYLDDVKKEYSEVQRLSIDLEEKTKILNDAKAKLAEITKGKDLASTKLDVLLADLKRVKASQEKLAPEGTFSSWKRSVMQWPIMNGLNSPHKIQQIWLPNLKVPVGVVRTARFDRCITCHQAEDKVLAGNQPAYPHGDTGTNNVKDWVAQNKYPHPFATHPNADLYLTSTSPHPMTTFGCTICHDGQGSGTNFSNASHTPNSPHQNNEWAKDLNYASNHYWEFPMQPKRFIESSCLKCHHNVTELGVNPKFGATAPKLVRGFELVKKYGCFGCHEIKGFEGNKQFGPDLRLEPSTKEELARIAADPSLVPGRMRKVGPSLRYLSQKTTTAFVETWTKEPKAFRPSTKMPQFFDLTNQTDSHAKNMMPVEIAAITHYLMSKSSANEVELLEPPQNHKPDIVRGKKMFSQKGCLACHSHKEFSGATQTFGPRLDNVNQKIKPGKEGFKWLFSWIRDPQRYHKRSKMPDLFIKPKEAADITAFLLQGKPGNFKPIKVDEKVLDELTSLFLQSALTKADLNRFMASRKYPIAPQDIKGDEVELLSQQKGKVTDEEWKQMRLSYVGKRTISRYGCFGCHDIPGFEKARPIGTALQDWGRKDTSKLALEHISEFLHHHGEADGSSTSERVEKAKKQMKAGGYSDKKLEEKEMRTTFFYESLHHHGRPGFLWQKLRAPRSYDYEKIEVKRYDERLKMPKFPLNEDEIEEIATFILGLTADPPTEEYLYHLDKRTADRIEGERLLKKFNCVGCHMMELPKFKYGLPTKTPGLDNGLAGLIGMPKKEILNWLNTNREKLIQGNTVEIPKEIDVVLYNVNEFLRQELKGKKLTPQQQAVKLAKLIEAKYQDNRRYDKLNAFFAKHPAVLLVGKMESAFYPQFVEQLLTMKKPHSGNTSEKFFNAQDFANWLEAIAKKPHPAHKDQLRKLRELGVNTDQIQKLAKSIVDGKYETDVIAFFDKIEDEETAQSIKEVEVITPRRKRLIQLFDKQGKIIIAMLTKKGTNKEKKERSEDFEKFGEWLIEKSKLPQEKTKKSIEQECKKFIAEHKKKKTLDKKEIEGIVSFLKNAKKEKWDIENLASSLLDESLLQDLSEEIAEYKKNVVKRIELTKLFDANKAELTQVLGGAVIQFYGLYNKFPDKTEPLLGQSHSLNLWKTLEVNSRLLLPSKTMNINQTRLIEIQPARGGEFAQWMVRNSSGKGTLGDEWAKAPPVLISQGTKVQTPWLYRFLKEPTQIRFSPVLRMPKFNMSDQEAHALANYFAAVDDVPYPYQLVPERKPLYAEKRNSNISKFLKEKDVMTESWKMLNGDLCIKCHSVGGRQFIPTKAKPNAEPPSQGPDLFNVQNRLRPDWVKVWIANPKWFIPYTKMPLNFPRPAPGKNKKGTLFNGHGDLRTIGVGDALMNYRKLIEAHGITPTPKPASTVAPNNNNDKKK